MHAILRPILYVGKRGEGIRAAKSFSFGPWPFGKWPYPHVLAQPFPREFRLQKKFPFLVVGIAAGQRKNKRTGQLSQLDISDRIHVKYNKYKG